jgi:hypothetical protein
MTPEQWFEIIKANLASVPQQSHTEANVQSFANEERDAKAAAAKAATPKVVDLKFRASSVEWLENFANTQTEEWQRANEPQLQAWAKDILAGRATVHLLADGRVEIRTRAAAAA